MDGFPFELILFSETMLQMWTDFARFGDPNGDPQQVEKTLSQKSSKKVHLVIMLFHTILSHEKQSSAPQLNGTSVWNPGQTMVFGVSGDITR